MNPLLDWLIELGIFFSVTIFLFTLNLILKVANNYFIDKLEKDILDLLNGGQASMLVMSYNLAYIKKILTTEQKHVSMGIVIVILSIGLIYNIVLYVQVKNSGVRHEGVIIGVSLFFLLVSILSTLLYTMAIS